MRVEISDGELVDKYTVLQLKSERITDRTKLDAVLREKEELEKGVVALRERFPRQYDMLYHTNQLIWDKTDEIKAMRCDNPGFATLAHEVFELNTQRFRIKRVFNCDSNLKEQKSYKETCVLVVIHHNECVPHKTKELDHLFLTYDNIFFQSFDQKDQIAVIDLLQKMYPGPTKRMDVEDVIILDEFVLS